MKSSMLEIVLSVAGCVLVMLVIFHKPVGLSDDWQWPLLIAATACWIPLGILQRRRRNARLAAGLPALEKPPTRGKFWLLLSVMVLGTLSGPLWMPYTGVVLPLRMQIITSIISCVIVVLVLVFSWRYWNRKV